MIPQLEEPEDKFFESIEEYKAKESQDVEDNEFPLPKMEDMHLKINEKNDLSPIDKKYLLDIFDVLNSYRKGEIERFDNLLTTVKEIFENISGSYYDLFEFCSKSKQVIWKPFGRDRNPIKDNHLGLIIKKYTPIVSHMEQFDN